MPACIPSCCRQQGGSPAARTRKHCLSTRLNGISGWAGPLEGISWRSKQHRREQTQKAEGGKSLSQHTPNPARASKGTCGNNPPRGAQGRKGGKDVGWGLGTGWWEGGGGGRGSNRNTKEGRRAIGGSNSTLLQLQRGPFSVPGPSGEIQEGRGPMEETAARSPGCTHGTGCQLEGKRAPLAPEGIGLVLFSFL